jgi:hypothetical protein
MAPPTNRGGGGDRGGGSCVSNAPAGGGGSDSGGSSAEELDELWPSRPSKAAAMLAQCWVDNPTASSNFTFGLGGVEYVLPMLPSISVFVDWFAIWDFRVRVLIHAFLHFAVAWIQKFGTFEFT